MGQRYGSGDLILHLKFRKVPEVFTGERGLGVDLWGSVYELLPGGLHLLPSASSSASDVCLWECMFKANEEN